MGPDVSASSGSQVNLTAAASDPDNDSLRMAWTKPGGSLWLFGWVLDSLFPDPIGDSVSFTAPSLARTATVAYQASVADGRGGGASGRQHATVLPAQNPGGPPSGSLTVSPADAAAGSTISVSFPVTDPEKGLVVWELSVGRPNSTSGTCCRTGSSTSVTLNDPGVYRISARAIDRELNLSTRESAVVRIGGAGGEPPIAAATLDKLSGPVPLTVNIDMSASSDPDGTIQNYFFHCEGPGATWGTASPQGSCTYETPGGHWIYLLVQDDSGNMDVTSLYAVATPGPDGGGGGTPPAVSITQPADGSKVKRRSTVKISGTAGSSASRVDFVVDSKVVCSGPPAGASCSCNWQVPAKRNATYQIQAKAYDAAGNMGVSSVVSVTAE